MPLQSPCPHRPSCPNAAMTRARPPAFPGMLVFHENVDVWITVGSHGITDEALHDTYKDKPTYCYRLPGEPGCPPVPEELRHNNNSNVVHYLLLSKNAWTLWASPRKGVLPEDALHVPEESVEKIRRWEKVRGVAKVVESEQHRSAYPGLNSAPQPCPLHGNGGCGCRLPVPGHDPIAEDKAFNDSYHAGTELRLDRCPVCGLASCMHAKPAYTAHVMRRRGNQFVNRNAATILDKLGDCIIKAQLLQDEQLTDILEAASIHVMKRAEMLK